jgi:hypothetical protein
MGGIGSGRQAEVYTGTVEESLSLDVNRFVREGSVRKGCQASGIISWDRQIGIKPSIGFEAQCFMENGYMRLQYTVSSLAMGEQVVNYNVELFTTRPYFGGVRWWFICPNQDCEKMVGKLYQPPGAKYFLCRTCQNLTYTSCRESHKYDSLDQQIAAGTGLDSKLVKRIFKHLI